MPTQRTCPTCHVAKGPDAFYRSCHECKECKKARSRQVRKLQARKVAAFEQLIGIFFHHNRPADANADT